MNEGRRPGKSVHYLINVTQDSFLDGLVLDDLTEDTTVTATNDKDLLRVGVGIHGKVGDHLLVARCDTISLSV